MRRILFIFFIIAIAGNYANEDISALRNLCLKYVNLGDLCLPFQPRRQGIRGPYDPPPYYARRQGGGEIYKRGPYDPPPYYARRQGGDEVNKRGPYDPPPYHARSLFTFPKKPRPTIVVAPRQGLFDFPRRPRPRLSDDVPEESQII